MGANYFQFGLNLSDNFKGDNKFNIGFAYTRTAINALNGEWRTGALIGQDPLLATELYQPLDFNSAYFINPQVFVRSQNLNVYSSTGDLQAEYRMKSYGVNFDIGRNFGTWGELRLGYQFVRGNQIYGWVVRRLIVLIMILAG